MEVWNKCDLLTEGLLLKQNGGRRINCGKPILVSALTGEGIGPLRAALEARLAAGRFVFDVWLDPSQGGELNWLHKNAEILRKTAAADGRLQLSIRVGPERVERVRRRLFPAEASA
jgi:GTP-binding protein HflX